MEAAHSRWHSLGELFVERGYISEADLERALAEQVATKRRLADILVSRGLVSGHDITETLLEQLASTGVAVTPPEPVPTPEPSHEAELLPFPVDPEENLDDEPLPAAWVKQVHVERDHEHSVPTSTQTSAEESPDTDALEKDEPSSSAAHPVATISAHWLTADLDARRRVAEQELAAECEAHAALFRGLEQVRVELEARNLSTEALVRELEEAKDRLHGREEELSMRVAMWDDARREVERADRQLTQLREQLEGKEHELAETKTIAHEWTVRVAELEAEAEALAGRVASAAQRLDDLASASFPEAEAQADRSDDGTDDAADSDSRTRVLYFMPRDEGYDLIEHDGPPPSVGETVELGERQFVVAKLGRSPLPFDRRSCVFLAIV